jgi:hypothetical protein
VKHYSIDYHPDVRGFPWDWFSTPDRYQSEHEQQGFLHAFILLRPTQTRNSGRAELCLVVQRWWGTL